MFACLNDEPLKMLALAYAWTRLW